MDGASRADLPSRLDAQAREFFGDERWLSGYVEVEVLEAVRTVGGELQVLDLDRDRYFETLP